MEIALSDSSQVYAWTIKIEKGLLDDEAINIGIASDPFSKPIGDCCDSSYNYSNDLKYFLISS